MVLQPKNLVFWYVTACGLSWLVVTKGFYLCSIYFEMDVLEPNLQAPSTALVCGFNLPGVCGSVKVCSLSAVVCLRACIYMQAPADVCVLEGHSLQTDESAASWSP